MKELTIRNLAGIVSGRLGDGLQAVDCVACLEGRIELGAECDSGPVLDAKGAVAIPGLIDSHAHVVFADWTPRQNTLGWIESSMHGGVSLMMSASEVHLPGRPDDRAGVKALALAAQRSWERVRPGGVKVLGGSVIIEPCLEAEDFPELAGQGVKLAKVGFGAFERQRDAAGLVAAAQAAGMIVMNHTGGASLPDSSPVDIEDVLALKCDIIGHANGGTTALPDDHLEALFEAPGAVQIVQAGNLRSALEIVKIAKEKDLLKRLIFATDTPTGTGVMPLGMIKTVVEMSSLGRFSACDAIACATGNNAAVLGREEGVLANDRPADLVLIQPPRGGVADTPLAAIELGDIPSITAVIIGGEIKALQSRNTPVASRPAELTPA